MGLFGWVGRAASSVGSAIKNTASKVVDTGKKVVTKTVETAKNVGKKVVDTTKTVYNKAKEGASNMWGKFSGKEDFKKAERLYEQIKKRYEEKKSSYDCEVESLTSQIDKSIQAINKYKAYIKRNLFMRMVKDLEKIKDIRVDKSFNLEQFKYEHVKLDSVRAKSQLYTIDFNKNKFKTTFQAIFTLGFFTRKKAKETLAAVQEEEGKVNHEIAKMDAELVKLRQIAASLQNVESYFSSLVNVYEQLLVRLSNNVNFLYFQCMQFAHQLISDQMLLERLPLVQRKEVEAIMTASKVLNVMVKAQISNVENVVEIKDFEKALMKQTTEIKNVYKAA